MSRDKSDMGAMGFRSSEDFANWLSQQETKQPEPVGEEVEVVGYQWLDTAHYRKKLPFECVSQQWYPLMTITQHQRLIEAERQRRWDGNEISSREHAAELEEAKQGRRVLAHEVEQLKAEVERLEWAVESEKVLRAQLAQQQVVLPERADEQGAPTLEQHLFRQGWNACLDEVQRLNGAKP